MTDGLPTPAEYVLIERARIQAELLGAEGAISGVSTTLRGLASALEARIGTPPPVGPAPSAGELVEAHMKHLTAATPAEGCTWCDAWQASLARATAVAA